MFYGAERSDSLRMGDVVSGFVLGAARLKEPRTDLRDYAVDLRSPQFAVVLTPCCSIGDKTIALAPLLPINQGWLKNPYWREDLTRINRTMRPEQAVPPDTWDRLPEEQKERRLEAGEAYALLEWFVYPPHQILGTYSLRTGGQEVTQGHYALDFRMLHRVECDAVVNSRNAPVQAKLLELAVPGRAELRTKLAEYFGRVPGEDAT